MSTFGDGLLGGGRGKPTIVGVGLGQRRDFANFSPMRRKQKKLTGIGFLGGWRRENFPRGITVGSRGFGCKVGFLLPQHRTLFGMWALVRMQPIRATFSSKQGWKGTNCCLLRSMGLKRSRRIRNWTVLFFSIIYYNKRDDCRFGPEFFVPS